ncbi:zinc ABC transporter ATP-binding protein ZnuC [Psychromonas sp. L1A2]|uniref:zinc ABC transporter ATP-binding protein ZnuC n=1 Tax=Psychromonas sp. L1A2 TaxID=2686356 RepID=UPI00135AF0AC|nr:zinc ABC transporter ATP-binding protein ZnuC [Psychromonas sp. L1A2]
MLAINKDNNSQPLLTLSNVNLQISGRSLLESVDLQLKPGEIVTVVGPNGAGKTTLLRVALGLQKPTSGKVEKAKDVTIGYVPQKLHIDPTFPITVRRFLALAKGHDKTKFVPLLKDVGAEHVIDSPLQGLSGGELQRVLMARALMREPDILVLDEPVQGVDVHGQVELYDLISRVRTERGCAILMVSHDLHLVMASTDRVFCLNKHICCSGTPEVVVNDPAYTALFGPYAARHLAFYVHDKEHQHDHEHHHECCGNEEDSKNG